MSKQPTQAQRIVREFTHFIYFRLQKVTNWYWLASTSDRTRLLQEEHKRAVNDLKVSLKYDMYQALLHSYSKQLMHCAVSRNPARVPYLKRMQAKYQDAVDSFDWTQEIR